jgi:hypothetical protein
MTDRSVSVAIPEVAGVLSASDVLASAHTIAELQGRDGMIPWFEGGHCDPWNHVEAAMALSACGMYTEAEAAYEWLADRQLADGSWFNYYLAQGVKDPRLDTNVCAYVATGVLQHFLVTGELDTLSRHWSMVEAAVDFVLRFQRPDGSVLWSVDASGSRSTWARSAPTGSWPPVGSATPWRTTPAPSRRRRSTRWTGTTRSSPAPCLNRRPTTASCLRGTAS